MKIFLCAAYKVKQGVHYCKSLLLVAILPCLIDLRNRHKWKDNIKMVLQEGGWIGMDWIDLAQDGQVAGACECSYTSPESTKWGEFLD